MPGRSRNARLHRPEAVAGRAVPNDRRRLKYEGFRAVIHCDYYLPKPPLNEARVDISELLAFSVKNKASDLHLSS
ncbi:MAG: hypothetical protein LDL16_00025, partial [Thiobacillus sp.]|nr:hypothetical protein [Thiobacillus sp.]